MSSSSTAGRSSASRTARCAAIAIASEPAYVRGSRCVIAVEAAMNGAIWSTSSNQAPMIGARITGPLPADCTPLRAGETPSHKRTSARSVPKPIAGGSASNLHESNAVPYFARLNLGSSTQAPAGFVEAAVDRAVVDVQRQYDRLQIDVTRGDGPTIVQITARPGGEG